MRRPVPEPGWPDVWRVALRYDLQEVFGEGGRSGYAYGYARRWAHTIELVQRATPPSARVLDVAAAQGNFTLALAELGYEVTWNDLRAELEGYVRLKHERGIVHFLPGNALELEPASFDVVLICEVIEHVAHPDEFLRSIARLVRPGGHVVMTTPNGEFVRNKLPRFSDCADPSSFEAVQFKPDADGHIFLLHPDEVHGLARSAGLEVVEVALFNNPLTQGFMKLGRVLRFLPPSLVQAVERGTRRLPDTLQRKLQTALAALLRRPGP